MRGRRAGEKRGRGDGRDFSDAFGRTIAYDGRDLGDVRGHPLVHVRRSLADVIRRHLAYDVPLVVFIFVCGNGVATGGLSLALPHEQGEHAHARRGDEPRRQVDDEDDRH